MESDGSEMSMDYVEICPPSIVYMIQQADLKSSDSSEILVAVQSEGDRRCVLAATEAVASRITEQTDSMVFDSFANTVATYGASFEPDQIPVIRDAYLRFPYDASIAGNYFAGLRITGIDLREAFRGRIRPDWSFKTPYSPGDTWDYFMYLASLKEPGALEALADKIAGTKKGNDVTLMLVNLAQLPGPEVTAILQSYAQDTRTADGVDGPGMAISGTVALLMTDRPN
jgi:hypothetical protein